MTETFEDAFLLPAPPRWASRRKFPERHSKFDTPAAALILGSVLAVVSSFSFEVVKLTNVLNSFSVLIELAAAVRLQYTMPDLHRPYKVPLGPLSVAVFLALVHSVAARAVLGLSSSLIITIITCIVIAASIGASFYFAENGRMKNLI